MLDIKKALTAGANPGLIPEQIDPELVELAFKETPLLKIFQEIPWSSTAYEWNERSALVTPGAYNESDTWSGGNSTFDGRKSISIKMVRAEGIVSNLLYETSKSLIDAWQTEIVSATQSIAQEVERLYIEGNSVQNAKEFDGLSNICCQTYNAACATLSMDIIDAAINVVQNNGGNPNLIVLSNRDLQTMHKIMRDKMVYNWEKIEVAAGVYLTHYRGIPLYGSRFIPITLGVSGAESYGFVLDTNQIKAPVVKNFTYEDMTAKVTTDGRGFRVKTWRALAVRGASKFHCKINAIK